MLYVRCSSPFILLRSAILHSVLHPFLHCRQDPVLHCTTECCSKCHAAVSVAPTHHNATRAPQKRCTRNFWWQTFSEWKRWSKLQGILGASSPEPSLPSDALQTEGARHFCASKRPWQIACIIEMSNQRNVYTLYLLNQKQTLQTNVYFSRVALCIIFGGCWRFTFLRVACFHDQRQASSRVFKLMRS